MISATEVSVRIFDAGEADLDILVRDSGEDGIAIKHAGGQAELFLEHGVVYDLVGVLVKHLGYDLEGSVQEGRNR